MSIIREVELEEFANGYYAVQPFYCDRGFAELIEGALPRECREPYLKVYRQFRHKESGTIVCDKKARGSSSCSEATPSSYAGAR